MAQASWQGRRESGGRGGGGGAFPGAIHFSRVKLGNIKFLHVNNMRDHSLFIEQDLSDKKCLALSEFFVLAVHWATTVTKTSL